METMHMFWNALTNENQLVMKIVCTPLIFIEIFLYMQLFLTITNIKSTTKQKVLFITSFSIVSLLNTYWGIMPFNTFVNVIALPLLIFIIFKTSILKAILSEIVTYLIVILVSVSLLPVYTKILNITTSVTTTVPIHKLGFSLIFYSFLYFIYKLCKKFNINISAFDKINGRNEIVLILNFIIGSLTIGFEYFILFHYIDYIPNHLVFLGSFILLVYFALSILSLFRTEKLEATTQSLEEQKLINKTLNTLHDNIRGFKHDFNNIVQSIGGYIGTNNIEGLKSYYKDLLEECHLNNNLSVLNPELINNPAIYSLLCDKHCKCQKLHISLNLDILCDLSNLNIKMYELSRILGILCDNAIEAASPCEKKIVNITFKKDKKNNVNLIIIQNTYANKNVNIDRIFEKGFTSKDESESDNKHSHGLGLWEVRKYLSKNKNLDLYTTKNDEFFSQQFEIYN